MINFQILVKLFSNSYQIFYFIYILIEHISKIVSSKCSEVYLVIII